MSAVTPVKHVIHQISPFIPEQPQQISLEEFEMKFQERKLAMEGSPVEYESTQSLVAPGVSECIALFGMHVDRTTQQIEWYCCYHMETETDLNAVDEFISTMDDKKYDLYLYLMGENEKNPKHAALLNAIKTSLRQTFGAQDHIVAEQINLINRPDSTSDMISIGLTKDGEIYWCYGDCD